MKENPILVPLIVLGILVLVCVASEAGAVASITAAVFTAFNEIEPILIQN